MKKFILILLAVMLCTSLFACGQKTDIVEPNISDEVEQQNIDIEQAQDEIESDDSVKADAQAEEQVKDNKAENKPAQKPSENKPVQKPAENKPEAKPENKPVESEPENKPEEKPTQSNPETLGGMLVAEFNKHAASKSGEELANAVLSIPEIEFFPVVVPVSEGDYLDGFGNAEIKGFKSAVKFSPMIGSIPFMGYIFETDNPTALASTLKANANLRWLICAEADEVQTAISGNKVFFVMCLKNPNME